MAKKLYYKIGEACKQLDIQPYVLRYWESEFTLLSPDKSSSGQRVYTKADLEVIRRIKELLYEEGYTIAGAKKRLEAEIAGESLPEAQTAPAAPAPAATEPAPAESAARNAPAAESALDSQAEKRIETPAEGLRELLAEAREILAYLDRPPAGS